MFTAESPGPWVLVCVGHRLRTVTPLLKAQHCRLAAGLAEVSCPSRQLVSCLVSSNHELGAGPA